MTYAVDLGGKNLDVLIQPDGKIVLVGWSERSQLDRDFVAVRLLSSGAIDTAFGAGGTSVVAFDLGGSNRDVAEAAVLQSDGKIVLAGSAERLNGDYDFAATRLLTDGRLDTSYGMGGRATVYFDRGGSNQDLANAAAIDSADRLVLAGQAEGLSHLRMDFAIARLMPSGFLDPGFNAAGTVTVGIDHGSGYDQATGVALAPGGKIVVAGRAHVSGSNVDFAATRLHADGTVDAGFGTAGRVRIPFDAGGSLRDDPTAMTIGLDGGIYITGPADTVSQRVLVAVVKLHGSPWLVLP